MRKISKRAAIKTPSVKWWVAPLVVAVVFGIFGVYTLLQSTAAPPGSFWGSGSVIADYSVYADTQNPDEQHQAGSTFARNYYLDIQQAGIHPQGPHHIQFYVRWYTKEVEHLENKFICGGVAPCVKIVEQEPSAPEVTNLIYCFDVTPAMQNQGNIKLFSTEFKQISASGKNWFGDILYMFSGDCTGQYEDGPPANSPNYLGYSHLGNGSLGNGIAGPTGESRGAGGGGGSGSSATTQSSKPNRIPTSSSQGSTKQPQITQPSPFYDGKLFAAGSDSYDDGGGPINLVRKVTLRGWIITSGVAIASLAGYFVWRWKRKL